MASSQGTMASSQAATAPTQIQGAKLYLAVVLLQVAYAISGVLAKAAIDNGMSPYAYSIYTIVFATVVFAPLAIIERRTPPANRRTGAANRRTPPAMTLAVAWRIVLMALLEPVADRILYHVALKSTSVTYASAMTNLLPAMMFILAWVLGLEQMQLTNRRSQAKILGTSLLVGGASVMTFYSGPTIKFPWTKVAEGSDFIVFTPAEHPVTGAIMIMAGCLCCAVFFTLQDLTLELYDAPLSLTSMVCGAGALQATLVTLIAERKNSTAWSIHPNPKLLAYVCGGIIASGIGWYVSATIAKIKGPVFATSFNPLSMVIVVFLRSLVLGEILNTGRVIGASVIIIGLYVFVWGKKRDNQAPDSSNRDADQEDRPVDEPSTETHTVEVEPSAEAHTVEVEPSVEAHTVEVEPSPEAHTVEVELSSGAQMPANDPSRIAELTEELRQMIVNYHPSGVSEIVEESD